MSTAALILAGGVGERMRGSETPKQFVDLAGKPVIAWSLELFEKTGEVDSVVVVCHRGFLGLAKETASKLGLKKVCAFVAGGETRQGSSLNGLKSLEASSPEVVLIHDAARPFITADIVERTIDAARKYGAATVSIPLADTLAQSSSGAVERFVPRAGLFRVQTPQGFDYGLIMEAHERGLAQGIFDATDDAQLVLALGREVRIVEGSETNLKITTDSDLKLARAIARELIEGAG